MTREEAIESLRGILTEAVEFENSACYVTEEDREPLEMAIEALEQEPCEDAISRQAVLYLIADYDLSMGQVVKGIHALPSVTPQEPKTGQFAKWVARKIFDDEWEYNKDAFAELACRKLAKLGIVQANGDEWELVESQESEDKCKNCEYYRNPDYTRCHKCEAESEG